MKDHTSHSDAANQPFTSCYLHKDVQTSSKSFLYPFVKKCKLTDLQGPN